MSKTAKKKLGKATQSSEETELLIPLQDGTDASNEYELYAGFLQYVDSRTGKIVRETPFHTAHKGPPSKLPIPPNRYRYESFIANDFLSWPKLEWMVDGLFHVGTLVMVWGASGAGKTAWLIDLVMSIARGEEWSGRQVTHNHVLFCAMEGAQGFRERVLAAAEHHKFTLGRELRFIFEAVDLTDPDRLNGLAAAADKYSIKMIVIDTLAAALAGKVDENSNQQMAAIIDNAKRLSQMTGATVLITHHTGHDTRNERGATALRGGVDTSISINRRDKRRYWRVVKQRDGDEGFGGYFDLLPCQFPGPDGEAVNSVIAQPGGTFTAENAPSGRGKASGTRTNQPKLTKSVRLSENQRGVLDKFQELLAQSAASGDNQEAKASGVSLSEAIDYCSAVIQAPEPKRRNQRTKDALTALASKGLLKQLPDGSLYGATS